MTTTRFARNSRSITAGLLGFSFGGFFDGILFHQILQWHHLLSRVDSIAGDLRTQILADGLFHAAMYFIAAAGLGLLIARPSGQAPSSGRRFGGWFLFGFGLWQIVDVVGMHWILGLHNIRIGPTWLFWDLVVLSAGIIFAALGGLLLRQRSHPPAGGALATVLALLTAVSGFAAAVPFSPSSTAAVVFPAQTPPGEALTALASAEARSIISNPAGDAWIIAVSDWRQALKLYSRGAIFVASGPVAQGCFASIEAAP